MTVYLQISLAELPDSSQLHVDFLDTTWFKTHGLTRRFPTPEHLRSLYKPHQLPIPVKLEGLGLIVKFGSHVIITEAINLGPLVGSSKTWFRCPNFMDGEFSSKKERVPKSSSTFNSSRGPRLHNSGLKCLRLTSTRSVAIYVINCLIFAVLETVNHSKSLVSLSGNMVRLC
jgi:hypothetical protein